MPTRNNKRIIRINDSDFYDELMEERGLKHIRQYLTETMGYPTTAQKMQFNTTNHVWKIGDRFYKLANEFYGYSRFCWVIAWYNKKPTEAHVEIGDVLAVPFPLA